MEERLKLEQCLFSRLGSKKKLSTPKIVLVPTRK